MLNTTSIANFTKLPVSEIVKSDKIGSALIISTPHKGKQIIEYKERHQYFFTTSETTKEVKKIILQMQKLEEEAREYLFNKWLEKNKD